ncbi:murein hydrolase activator EnvC family protein [Fusibacter tunisiensis]|uniref:Murein DD-endopeptidase MepM/ murein hydrolase activator NlpD n=1 Tax=Fusibacter tunisiensis TaxID=1008308 RepID=A0ABS2MR94_9FIRM|nr:peptidoglycan DD-metalloendopeptidase family protein [Fusibacter tunisiensis]MBM7561938.1 murein DD-endopeptidase MepM/ murein hydrolase activator NlpD [Fusibacter tunisiensis]
MKQIKIYSVFLLIVTLLFSGTVFANDELKRRERELEELKEKMEALDAELDANESMQSETNRKIKNLNVEIKGLEKEIDGLDAEIALTEDRIVEKTGEIEVAEDKISDKNILLNERLRVMYKTGSIGYLEVLFGAEDFNDLLSRIDMIQKVLMHDQNLIQTLKAQRDDLAQKKLDLEHVKDELLSLFQDKVSKQDSLEIALNNLVGYKAQLLEDEVAMKEVEEQFLKEANDLTEIIKNLELAPVYVGGEMLWPVPGEYTITSPFGNRLHPITKQYKMHTGIDIGAPMNTSIVAAQTGTIVYANWYGGYGKTIIVDHGGGHTTLYAHLNQILGDVGSVVKKGDMIGKMGTTGVSTGSHLHFEVRINGDYVDPYPYITGN